MKYVIIGSSAAGSSAVETLRKLDKESTITVISEEANLRPYSRCLLSDYIAGEIEEDGLAFKSADFFEKHNVETIFSVRAVRIDGEAKEVHLSNNEKVPYDKLLLATGSVNFVPPIKGVDSKGVFGLRSLEEARQIRNYTQKVRRALVLGGGLVGCETAYALYRTGIEVTVVEMASRLLPVQMDERASEILKSDMECEGIRVITGIGVQEIIPTGFWARLFGKPGKGVQLTNGERLKADMIVLAAGTRPAVGLLQEHNPGIQINHGILVNKKMETTYPDIYAAGDVAESIDTLTGKRSLSPIWPNAIIQGKVAASCMAGRPVDLAQQIAMQNACEFREVPTISIGQVEATEKEDQVLETYRPQERIYRKIVLRHGKVRGLLFMGDIRGAGLIGSLIRTQRDVTSIKELLLHPEISWAHVADQ
ncbi:NAD(P)/FAD-dependent oxidoreductase [Heliorestis acidaminivorans]|uniref:NAD(P)/FAD-dependent oxidoreductase n=1 Tax=Heliorestis acidaminivorans TaxID=553427 RepID=A0A6I0F1U0_9FIRM|nr:FAD-dependent oxidoreductase [Heliorestis acidaminivorans]KAB2953901.1 NAD(P)/FAD-dependent oxidoreductase [Heliorestis acidaminivorans]